MLIERRFRLDCVDELVANEDLAQNVDDCLSKLPKDLDKCGTPCCMSTASLMFHDCALTGACDLMHRVCSSFALRPVKVNTDPIRCAEDASACQYASARNQLSHRTRRRPSVIYAA